MAALLALEGRRVGVIDTNLHSPGIEVLFNLREEEISYWLNDYLSGDCEIEQAAYDVTGKLDHPVEGRIFLVPASMRPVHIARALRHGYDLSLLSGGLKQLTQSLQLDVFVVDMGAGVHDDTLNVLASAAAAGVILRLDHQDYQGTDVIVRLAHKLGVPRTLLIVNNIPAGFDAEMVKKEVESTYGCEVAAVLPDTEELMLLASRSIFVLRYPEHPLTAELRRVTSMLADPWNVAHR
jgi:MinD-like ATPase involved in chromosome partitioning or flagellar assembly